MGLRSDALSWFGAAHAENVYVSKFYRPDESWNKKCVWWFRVPPKALTPERKNVHLLAEVSPGEKQFHHLNVPVSFFNDHLGKFHRIGEQITFYLSAEEDSLFVEQRGSGNLNFSQFLV